MPKNELIILIIIFVVIIVYDISRNRSILNSQIPQAVIDFPVYESTEEEFNSLRQEIEPFFLDSLENRRSELILTAKQLNCISTRGILPIKGKKIVFPTYYEIENGRLIEKQLSYPSRDSITGYTITIWTTEFAGTMCYSELISVNDLPPSSDNFETRVFPFEKSELLISLCDFDGKKRIQLAKNLTIVEIQDDKLVLRI